MENRHFWRKSLRFYLKLRKISIFHGFLLLKNSKGGQEGYTKIKFGKNTPEMNELERDLIAVQFLTSNFEKQKF